MVNYITMSRHDADVLEEAAAICSRIIQEYAKYTEFENVLSPIDDVGFLVMNLLSSSQIHITQS